MGSSALKAVCIDCARPAALARWWAETLGYHVREYRDQDLAGIRAGGGGDSGGGRAVVAASDPTGAGS